MADPIGSTTGTTSTTGTATPAQLPGSSLGKDDFLKMLAVQMQNQDPMNPMDDKDFMAQLAQFSSLEQLQNLGASTDQMVASNAITRGMAMIGKTVSYLDSDGHAHSGKVDGLEIGSDGLGLEIGNDLVDPNAVVEVTG
jgi:flagellar basal-body rod modification protein FlgD